MKPNFNIFTISTTLAHWVLILLFVISPCKVRQYLQVSFSSPPPLLLKKSQSPVSPATCQIFKTNDPNQTTAEHSQQPLALLGVAPYRGIPTVNKLQGLELLNISSTPQAVTMPLYILYQNLKIYS